MCYAANKYSKQTKGNRPIQKMIKILFVCLGNICRSPLAEAIFQQKIKDRKLEDQLSCDSAGTANYHVGDRPDPRTIRVAANHDVPVDHVGRQFKRNMAADFTYLIAMDYANLRNMILELDGVPAKVFLMRHFDAQAKDADVPDPYYGDMTDFEEVYQILDRSLEAFMAFLIEKHELRN